MTKHLFTALAACFVLALGAEPASAETTGKGPAPEATNPAPSREMNQTDRQEAAPPGKDTGPDTQAPSKDGEMRRTDTDRTEQGSGGSGTAPTAGAKPAR